MPEILEVTKQIEEIQQQYKEMMGDSTAISILLMGIFGAGKTRCACTGRLPILVDVFDPKGTVIFHTDPYLNKLRKEKRIILRPFWAENSQEPTMYKSWEKQWMADCKSGFLSLFGTYVIDSGTTWMEAMANYISKTKGRKYDLGGKDITGNLRIEDYIPMYNIIMDAIKMTSSHGCDFIYTAHLLTIEDEVTQRITAVLDIYKRLKSKVPKLFSEKYVMSKRETAGSPKHELIIHSTGKFEASSQLMAKGGIADIVEPDLKALLKLAGLPVEDKPIPWITT
ncbi:hypothetical protein LCGC14_0395420 [marine sediment metagenome]|uniref:Uncharacterized protein n=1 Tax=marine sediment metagenome TaxID=412755 RepID=A0A0F9VKE1_9ZZZZ